MGSIVSFLPIQEGSGIPSPENVRPIRPALTIDGIGDIYGGSIDLDTGVLSEEWYKISIDGTASMRVYNEDNRNAGLSCIASYFLNTFGAPQAGGYIPRNTDGYSNVLAYLDDNYSHISHVGASNTTTGIVLEGTRPREDFLSWLSENGPVEVCYKLATPTTYTLTPAQLNSAIHQLGYQVPSLQTYRRMIMQAIRGSIAYEARNLSFDGTNYINTKLQLFSQENINRNFEVRIVGIQGDYQKSATETLVCAKENSQAIGFLIRPSGWTERKYNGTIYIKRSTPGTMVIRRVNGVLSCEGSNITNQPVPFAANTVFDYPLIFGAALYVYYSVDSIQPYRYCAGTIDYICVRWL